MAKLEYVICSLISAIFIIVRHPDNTRRLLASKERKLGEKFKVDNLPSPGNQYIHNLSQTRKA